MKKTSNIINDVSSEICKCIKKLNPNEIESAAKLIINYNKIFLLGAGRSKLSLSCFAMRLMHLGKKVHIIGDVTTPSITIDDLLVIASGSGNTETVSVLANKAKDIGCKLLLFTHNENSSISRIADEIIFIKAPSFLPNESLDVVNSVQPIASLFEQMVLILTDIIILKIIQNSNSIIDLKKPFPLHANLQ